MAKSRSAGSSKQILYDRGSEETRDFTRGTRRRQDRSSLAEIAKLVAPLRSSIGENTIDVVNTKEKRRELSRKMEENKYKANQVVKSNGRNINLQIVENYINNAPYAPKGDNFMSIGRSGTAINQLNALQTANRDGAKITTFDLETIGYDMGQSGTIGHGQTITEIAALQTVNVGGEEQVVKKFSTAIGFSPEEYNHAVKLVEKYKKGGFNNLDKHEQVAIQRLALIGNKKTEIDIQSAARNKGIVPYQTFASEEDLGINPGSKYAYRVKDVEFGLQRQKELGDIQYKKFGGVGHIFAEFNDMVAESDVLSGHNIINFDIPIVQNKMTELGINSAGLQKAQYLDTLTIARATNLHEELLNNVKDPSEKRRVAQHMSSWVMKNPSKGYHSQEYLVELNRVIRGEAVAGNAHMAMNDVAAQQMFRKNNDHVMAEAVKNVSKGAHGIDTFSADQLWVANTPGQSSNGLFFLTHDAFTGNYNTSNGLEITNTGVKSRAFGASPVKKGAVYQIGGMFVVNPQDAMHQVIAGSDYRLNTSEPIYGIKMNVWNQAGESTVRTGSEFFAFGTKSQIEAALNDQTFSYLGEQVKHGTGQLGIKVDQRIVGNYNDPLGVKSPIGANAVTMPLQPSDIEKHYIERHNRAIGSDAASNKFRKLNARGFFGAMSYLSDEEKYVTQNANSGKSVIQLRQEFRDRAVLAGKKYAQTGVLGNTKPIQAYFGFNHHETGRVAVYGETVDNMLQVTDAMRKNYSTFSYLDTQLRKTLGIKQGAVGNNLYGNEIGTETLAKASSMIQGVFGELSDMSIDTNGKNTFFGEITSTITHQTAMSTPFEVDIAGFHGVSVIAGEERAHKVKISPNANLGTIVQNVVNTINTNREKQGLNKIAFSEEHHETLIRDLAAHMGVDSYEYNDEYTFGDGVRRLALTPGSSVDPRTASINDVVGAIKAKGIAERVEEKVLDIRESQTFTADMENAAKSIIDQRLKQDVRVSKGADKNFESTVTQLLDNLVPSDDTIKVHMERTGRKEQTNKMLEYAKLERQTLKNMMYETFAPMLERGTEKLQFELKEGTVSVIDGGNVEKIYLPKIKMSNGNFVYHLGGNRTPYMMGESLVTDSRGNIQMLPGLSAIAETEGLIRRTGKNINDTYYSGKNMAETADRMFRKMDEGVRNKGGIYASRSSADVVRVASEVNIKDIGKAMNTLQDSNMYNDMLGHIDTSMPKWKVDSLSEDDKNRYYLKKLIDSGGDRGFGYKDISLEMHAAMYSFRHEIAGELEDTGNASKEVVDFFRNFSFSVKRATTGRADTKDGRTALAQYIVSGRSSSDILSHAKMVSVKGKNLGNYHLQKHSILTSSDMDRIAGSLETEFGNEVVDGFTTTVTNIHKDELTHLISSTAVDEKAIAEQLGSSPEQVHKAIDTLKATVTTEDGMATIFPQVADVGYAKNNKSKQFLLNEVGASINEGLSLHKDKIISGNPDELAFAIANGKFKYGNSVTVSKDFKIIKSAGGYETAVNLPGTAQEISMAFFHGKNKISEEVINDIISSNTQLQEDLARAKDSREQLVMLSRHLSDQYNYVAKFDVKADSPHGNFKYYIGTEKGHGLVLSTKVGEGSQVVRDKLLGLKNIRADRYIGTELLDSEVGDIAKFGDRMLKELTDTHDLEKKNVLKAIRGLNTRLKERGESLQDALRSGVSLFEFSSFKEFAYNNDISHISTTKDLGKAFKTFMDDKGKYIKQEIPKLFQDSEFTTALSQERYFHGEVMQSILHGSGLLAKNERSYVLANVIAGEQGHGEIKDYAELLIGELKKRGVSNEDIVESFSGKDRKNPLAVLGFDGTPVLPGLSLGRDGNIIHDVNETGDINVAKMEHALKTLEENKFALTKRRDGYAFDKNTKVEGLYRSQEINGQTVYARVSESSFGGIEIAPVESSGKGRFTEREVDMLASKRVDRARFDQIMENVAAVRGEDVASDLRRQLSPFIREDGLTNQTYLQDKISKLYVGENDTAIGTSYVDGKRVYTPSQSMKDIGFTNPDLIDSYYSQVESMTGQAPTERQAAVQYEAMSTKKAWVHNSGSVGLTDREKELFNVQDVNIADVENSTGYGGGKNSVYRSNLLVNFNNDVLGDDAKVLVKGLHGEEKQISSMMVPVSGNLMREVVEAGQNATDGYKKDILSGSNTSKLLGSVQYYQQQAVDIAQSAGKDSDEYLKAIGKYQESVNNLYESVRLNATGSGGVVAKASQVVNEVGSNYATIAAYNNTDSEVGSVFKFLQATMKQIQDESALAKAKGMPGLEPPVVKVSGDFFAKQNSQMLGILKNSLGEEAANNVFNSMMQSYASDGALGYSERHPAQTEHNIVAAMHVYDPSLPENTMSIGGKIQAGASGDHDTDARMGNIVTTKVKANINGEMHDLGHLDAVAIESLEYHGVKLDYDREKMHAMQMEGVVSMLDTATKISEAGQGTKNYSATMENLMDPKKLAYDGQSIANLGSFNEYTGSELSELRNQISMVKNDYMNHVGKDNFSMDQFNSDFADFVRNNYDHHTLPNKEELLKFKQVGDSKAKELAAGLGKLMAGVIDVTGYTHLQAPGINYMGEAVDGDVALFGHARRIFQEVALTPKHSDGSLFNFDALNNMKSALYNIGNLEGMGAKQEMKMRHSAAKTIYESSKELMSQRIGKKEFPYIDDRYGATDEEKVETISRVLANTIAYGTDASENMREQINLNAMASGTRGGLDYNSAQTHSLHNAHYAMSDRIIQGAGGSSIGEDKAAMSLNMGRIQRVLGMNENDSVLDAVKNAQSMPWDKAGAQSYAERNMRAQQDAAAQTISDGASSVGRYLRDEQAEFEGRQVMRSAREEMVSLAKKASKMNGVGGMVAAAVGGLAIAGFAGGLKTSPADTPTQAQGAAEAQQEVPEQSFKPMLSDSNRMLDDGGRSYVIKLSGNSRQGVDANNKMLFGAISQAMPNEQRINMSVNYKHSDRLSNNDINNIILSKF